MYMLILCYESSASLATQEILWLAVSKNGWMSAGPVEGINRFYIPEDRVAWAILVDSTLRRVPEYDYVA
jgi:hypothetical protein